MMVLGLAFCAESAACTNGASNQETVRPDAAEDAMVARMRQDNASLRKRLLELESRVRRLERDSPQEEHASARRYERHPSTVGRTSGIGSDSGSNWSAMDAQRPLASTPPRNLPVVKLERETSADRREGRVTSAPRTGSDGDSQRTRESVSLSTIPHTGVTGALAQEVGSADAYEASTSSSVAADTSTYSQDIPSDWVVASEEMKTSSRTVDDGSEDTIDAGGDAPRRTFKLVGTHLVEATKVKRQAPKKQKRSRKRTSSTRRTSGPEAAYKQARALYTSGDIVAAERAFDAFARTYPRHEHADNALYWKGEAAYDQAHFSDALAAFTEVIEKYGGGNKASDALLKIGLCYGKVGDKANAQDVLEQLVLAYPNARASAIAKKKLREMSGATP